MNQEHSLQELQERIGYSFKNPELLIESLTHSSIADSRLSSNERLEFVGDAILGMVVCQELYHRFPDYLEGELTKIKSAVVSRRVCAQMAQELELTRYLILGKGMGSRHQLPSSLAAAVYEALIAAIFLDSGKMEVARKFILDSAGEYITQAAESEHQRNFKSQLQQYAQKVLAATPSYELLDEKGPDHSKCFEVSVVVNGHRYASAWGPSKKEAEQKAAYLALRELEAIEPTPEFEPDLFETSER